MDDSLKIDDAIGLDLLANTKKTKNPDVTNLTLDDISEDDRKDTFGSSDPLKTMGFSDNQSVASNHSNHSNHSRHSYHSQSYTSPNYSSYDDSSKKYNVLDQKKDMILKLAK